MRNHRIYAVSTSILVIILMLVLTDYSGAQETKEVFKGRFSYHWFPTHGSAIQSEKFVKMVHEKTKGQVQLTTFGSAQLYTLQQIVTAVSTGAVDIGGVTDTSFVSVDPNIGLTSLPFYWSGFEQIRQLWEETQAGRKHWEDLQKKLNIKVLAYVPVGAVMPFSVKKPLYTPADFQELKSRYLTKAEIPMYEAMGASPVFVQSTEVYTALQTGMVDIVPTIPSGMKSNGWWQYLKFGVKPNMYFWDAYIVVNATWWNKLPEEIRNTITKEICTPLSKQATEEAATTYGDKILEEWERTYGGKVITLTKEQQDAYRNLFRSKVWPAQISKMDPALLSAAEKITGIPLK